MADCSCLWCGRAFMPRTTGGHMQRFCSAVCRRALDAAGRRWIAAALGTGTLTVVSLKDASAATRALPPGTTTEKDATILSGIIPEEAAELLDDTLVALLELPDDVWSAVMVALPHELYDRIDGYIQAAFTEVVPQAEEAIYGSPEAPPAPRKRPSGAHWRKLARERAAQQEASQ